LRQANSVTDLMSPIYMKLQNCGAQTQDREPKQASPY